MEVASSSSATGKLKFSPDWNLAIARFRSPLAFQKCRGSNDSVSHYTRPDAHTRKPRSGVRGWRLRKLNLNDVAPRMCTQRGAEAPLGRAVSSRFAPVGSDAPETAPTPFRKVLSSSPA
jgi:hypothetical protein